jgi:hypothetical protein
MKIRKIRKICRNSLITHIMNILMLDLWILCASIIDFGEIMEPSFLCGFAFDGTYGTKGSKG